MHKERLIVSNKLWLLFGFKGDPLRLDPQYYEYIRRVDGKHLIPAWVCLRPDRGLHLRRELINEDVYIVDKSKQNHDISSVEYGLKLVRVSWFESISRLIKIADYRLSPVLTKGREIDDWKILSTRNMPRLRMEKERIIPACSNCGASENYWGIEGKAWLDIRDSSGDEIFATPNGIFIRCDIFEKSGITPPRGAFSNAERVYFK